MRRPSQSLQVVLVVIALVAVAAAGYLFVIGPKRSQAADLGRRLEATELQIAAARARAGTARPATPVLPGVDAAELFRLTKAMPDSADMADVVLALDRIAADTGIALESIAPGAPAEGDGYRTLPITLSFEGNFYNLSDFLFRLRTLVAVRDGKLTANGRLFNVQTITFGAGQAGFPQLAATVTVNAYVFGANEAPAAAAPAPAAETDEATPTAAGDAP
jgi:Tfp pilus assembly protein PilO